MPWHAHAVGSPDVSVQPDKAVLPDLLAETAVDTNQTAPSSSLTQDHHAHAEQQMADLQQQAASADEEAAQLDVTSNTESSVVANDTITAARHTAC